MEKSIKNAFTYMFQDKDWVFKVSILVLLSIPSAFYTLFRVYPDAAKNFIGADPTKLILFLLVSAVMLFASLISSGYICKSTNGIITGDLSGNEYIPAWESDFLSFLKIGFIYLVAQLLTGLAFLIPFLLIIPAIIFAFLRPVLYNIFCTEYKITAFFQWKKAFDMIKVNSELYWGVILTKIGIFLLVTIVTIVLMLTAKFFLVFIIPFISAYFALVDAFLCGILRHKTSEVEIVE